MKKDYLIGKKRYVFYTLGLILYPTFVRSGNDSLFVNLIPIIIIGSAVIFSIINHFFLYSMESNWYEEEIEMKHNDLFIAKGRKKIRVNLEYVNNPMIPIPSAASCGYLYSYYYNDGIGTSSLISHNNDSIIGAEKKENTKKAKKAIPDLLFNFDRRGFVRFVTEETASTYGMKLEDFYGKNYHSLENLFGIDFDIWMEKLRSEGHCQSTVEVEEKGQRIWIYWSFEAITDGKNEIEMIIATGHEITDIIVTGQVKDRIHDQLTGLLNQQGLYETLACLRNVRRATMFFIDLWNFTRINDYYGYHAGNEIIVKIADELKDWQDGNYIISRFSGDRFIVVILNEKADSLEEMLANLRKMVSNTYRIGDQIIQIDKRIGYASYPDNTLQLDKLIPMASLAMQQSKPENQFTIIRYERYMGEALKKNIVTATKLKKALDEHKIEVHFQKTVDSITKDAVYVEELARWNDSELGFVSPLVLFSVAKEFNLLEQLDKYMIEEAVRSFSIIRTKPEYSKTKLTVNLAPGSFMDYRFLNYLNDSADKYHVEHSDICIEISEATFINSLDECNIRIASYKNDNYLIALDDFGKEYSSLAILECVAFDIIKIDKIFIDHIFDKKNQEIIKMIKNIADIGQKEIISEGVETKDQSDTLLNLGCPLQQGYFYHKPEKLT
ncbi:MAG TPA: EAL domain-containing protein [Bacillota bacterium]|nr:EAL domain-containing protein [Bacillota bacterium]HPF42566.1 EAL domain-containing protein [Bacillota bacterium]HPJ85876.1 EAL domain-containing protein [Bacillota bacterium]HPQ62166.1 EAL domain-containing protein [Bacillota bacterium]HRX91574.1 EAL domain-containing protein [Candidatus Izemoplasmatales bacterium]